MSEQQQVPPPGWYPDGQQWTEQAHPKPQPSGDFTVQIILGLLLILVILVGGFLLF